jgi:hypothetical protein
MAETISYGPSRVPVVRAKKVRGDSRAEPPVLTGLLSINAEVATLGTPGGHSPLRDKGGVIRRWNEPECTLGRIGSIPTRVTSLHSWRPPKAGLPLIERSTVGKSATRRMP